MGASWRTSLVGYIAIASGVVGFIVDLIATQGMPKTIPEYFLFAGLVLGGIGNLLAKDAVVSNSGTNAPAHDVKT
jgi:uncharacterized YccA/Bax inhibitor family protein